MMTRPFIQPPHSGLRYLCRALAMATSIAGISAADMVLAQTGPEATVENIPSDQPAGPATTGSLLPCSSATHMAVTCDESRPVMIGLRDNLGNEIGKIDKIVRQNPLARVGWSSEYEISRSPEDPLQIVLFDMFNPPAPRDYEDEDVSERSNNYDVNAINRMMTQPIPVGAIDAPDLAASLNEALEGIIRVRALSLLSSPPYERGYELCAETVQWSCPQDGASNIEDLRPGNAVRFGIRNKGEHPQFVYVLMVEPDNQLKLVISPADNGGLAVSPGALVESGSDPVTLETGRYRLFTIRSDSPINTQIFATGAAPGPDRGNCLSTVERVLCHALSGKNIVMPTWNDTYGTDWRISLDSIYAKTRKQKTVGGGSVVPNGFAPWQVQIYSTQTYSEQQIIDDRKLGRNGKMLFQQKPFQRYHRCAGSLISLNVVLTAAHCVANETVAGAKVLSTREVRVGTQNLQEGGAEYQIVSVVVHRGYSAGSQKDDIAVMRIAPKNISIRQGPILLPSDVGGFKPIGDGDQMTVLGWGYTGIVRANERHEMTQAGPQFAQDRLRMADLEALNLGECRKRVGNSFTPRKICGVTPKKQAGAGITFSCRGDSGGPVIQRFNGRTVQVGLVSGGVGCGANNDSGVQQPSLFVDLMQYADWIKDAEKHVLSIRNKVDRYP
ncbi:MAG: serine protease [Sphingorhabdus sp.]